MKFKIKTFIALATPAALKIPLGGEVLITKLGRGYLEHKTLQERTPPNMVSKIKPLAWPIIFMQNVI